MQGVLILARLAVVRSLVSFEVLRNGLLAAEAARNTTVRGLEESEMMEPWPAVTPATDTVHLPPPATPLDRGEAAETMEATVAKQILLGEVANRES